MTDDYYETYSFMYMIIRILQAMKWPPVKSGNTEQGSGNMIHNTYLHVNCLHSHAQHVISSLYLWL